MPAYLDHASTEPLHPAARQAWDAAVARGYADPLRLHTPAREARLLLDNARAAVAESLRVRPDEVTFTSSGTAAVHLGLLGLLRGRRRVGTRLVHSAVEHSAVFAAARWWGEATADGADGADGEDGASAVTVGVGPTGRLRLDELDAALADPVGALAVQQGNPEVGTLQPLDEVATAAERAGVPLFVDACAVAGRLDLPPGYAAAALSAHKWGGPAGVGVLVVRRGTRWRAPFPTDDRTDHRTSGFENVPGALAAAAALQARVQERETLDAHCRQLADRLVTALRGLPDVEVHGDPAHRLPHVVSFSCLYVDGEALVGELDRRGLRVASGSACTSSALEPSHVLVAMGALTHGNVRVSFGSSTTADDVDALVTAVEESLDLLRARVV